MTSSGAVAVIAADVLHGSGGTLVSLALIALASSMWHVRLMALAFASRSWPTVPGRLLRAQFVEGSRPWVGHAEVSYSYEVYARKLTGWRIRFAPAWGRSTIAEAWDVDDYRGVREVTVHYDPDAPERSVLEPGPTPRLWLAIVISIAVTALACWGIVVA